jgi:hypothetical protein
MPYVDGEWVPTRPKDRTEKAAWGPYTFGRNLTEHMGRAGIGAKGLGRLLQGLDMPAQGPWGGGVGRGDVVGMNDIRSILSQIPLLPWQMQMLQALAPNFEIGMNPLMPPGRQAGPPPGTEPPPPPPPGQPTPQPRGGNRQVPEVRRGPGAMPGTAGASQTQQVQQPQQMQQQPVAPMVPMAPVINPGAPMMLPPDPINRFQPNPAISAYLSGLQQSPPIPLPGPVISPYGRFLP